MTEVGVITGERQVFTEIFIRVGGMITGIIGGEGNRGNITGYITMIFITIGVTGKEQGIGTLEDLVGVVVTVVGAVETVDVVVTAVGAVVVEAVPAVVVETVPVVVELVSVEENPVYNLVPIIRKMIRRTGQKITRQNVKQPHNKIITVEKPCQL